MTQRQGARRWLEGIDDAFLLGVVAVMIPIAVAAIGAPVALVAWLVDVVARRW